ncbi:hypothetical protein EYF80_028070 [Liparis tanakae]|uniref:Uncharacterized protein n=1 Tax=Liparis tanakae TaxID=230148 RepID=A0A4Z2H6Z9_9TELE|nr:hypothetical protein EYF80_028070 [Liparis tanakae]
MEAERFNRASVSSSDIARRHIAGFSLPTRGGLCLRFKRSHQFPRGRPAADSFINYGCSTAVAHFVNPPLPALVTLLSESPNAGPLRLPRCRPPLIAEARVAR